MYLTQCVSDIERYVTDKSAQVLRKSSKAMVDKFVDVRRKLKDKELLISGDLKDAEQLTTLYITVEERQKVVEEKFALIKEDSNDPEEIRRNFEIVKVCYFAIYLSVHYLAVSK